MKRSRMKRPAVAVALALAVMVAAPVLALAQSGDAQSGGVKQYDLGEAGDIRQWLVLGYIPLTVPNGQADWAKVMDTDLLACVGGEAGEKRVPPQGGQTVTIAASAANAPVQIAWRLGRTHRPDMCPRNPTEAIWLFNDDKGQVIENAACYLYCRLVSPADMQASFLLGSDDSVKVFLNGKLVHRYVGQRSANDGSDEVALSLKKGLNDLLVRVDNYVGNGGFICRLVDSFGAPLDSLKVQLAISPSTAQFPAEPLPEPTWDQLVKDIPPVPPAEHQDLFGSRLARTMSLLETGGQTHRPVRIYFYGQSIETGWPDMLIHRLRQRYPRTEIIGVNRALGGWGVYLLVEAMKHDLLRSQPDLVLMHAYAGSAEQWERFFANIRSQTTAEIMIRTAHIDAGEKPGPSGYPIERDESPMLRALAQKYDVEMVNLREEWLNYLTTYKLAAPELLRDPIHLNRKGETLMAELYERHFRANMLGQGGWFNAVRRYDVMRFFGERKADELVFTGGGWTADSRWARSSSSKDAMTLKFVGNRVDLVLAPCPGGARILIDGKSPSQLNLVHGTLPLGKSGPMYQFIPTNFRTYYTGPNMLEETWDLTFTHVSPDRKHFRYRLCGSRTGPDGEGDSESEFVSKSGRIAISPKDIVPVWDKPGVVWKPSDSVPVALSGPAVLAWSIRPDYRDEVRGTDAQSPDGNSIPFTYVTVADGLPCGRHELTVIPLDGQVFAITAVEVHKPPMAP